MNTHHSGISAFIIGLGRAAYFMGSVGSWSVFYVSLSLAAFFSHRVCAHWDEQEYRDWCWRPGFSAWKERRKAVYG